MIYLYLTPEIKIERDDVIGVFDLDNTTQSPATRKLLRYSEKAGRLTVASKDIPRSFILTGKSVYFAQNTSANYAQKLNELFGLTSHEKTEGST